LNYIILPLISFDYIPSDHTNRNTYRCSFVHSTHVAAMINASQYYHYSKKKQEPITYKLENVHIVYMRHLLQCRHHQSSGKLDFFTF